MDPPMVYPVVGEVDTVQRNPDSVDSAIRAA